MAYVVAPTRVIHHRNREGVTSEVYIGRAGHGYDGPFGNPIRTGEPCPVCRQRHVAGLLTLDCYRIWLEFRILGDRAFRASVRGLAGKTLVCWCKPAPCHGDLLAAVADRLIQGM